MLGDLANSIAKTRAIDISKEKPFHAHTCVRRDGKMLEGDEEKEETMMTGGAYISYKPRRDQPKYKELGDYIVKPREGVKGKRTRYKSWEEYEEKADEDETQRLIKKWSYISKEYFELARANAGVTIEVGFNWEGYNEHLKGLWREKYGEDPPPGVRLLSREIEGDASMESEMTYKKEMYENSIERKKRRRI